MRLTNDMRNKILFALMEHRFQSDEDAVHKRWTAFADDVYNDMYAAWERELIAKMPAAWVSKDLTIYISFAGKQAALAMSEARPNPSRQRKVYHASHPLSLRFEDLVAQSDKLRVDLDKAMAEVKAALESVQTVKKLLELWPEISSFVPKVVTYSVPAPRFDDLNRALKLPPKAKVIAT